MTTVPGSTVRRLRPRVAVWPTAIAIWFVLSFHLHPEIADGAERAGAIVGSLLVPLVVALVARGIYVAVRHRPRAAVWSPWLFAIAALVALPVRLQEVGDRAAAVQRADQLSAPADSQKVRDCIAGGVDRAAESDMPTAKRAYLERVTTRACRVMEQKGLLNRDPSDPAVKAQMTRIVERIVADDPPPATPAPTQS